MAVRTRGKGTVLSPEINSVYTAIPQIISIDITGEVPVTYDGTTLDGSVHPARPASGFVSNPDISFECFWDSGDTVHTFLKTNMRTPPINGVNFRHSDAATVVVNTVWSVQSIGIDEKYAANDGVKATVTLQTSGNPS